MNKFLFLDIDGVLNCKADFERENRWDIIESIKFDRFMRIINQVNPKIIIHSTWRFHPEAKEIVNKLFASVKITNYIWLESNHKGSYFEKAEDISIWLMNNSNGRDDKIAIIDDDFLWEHPCFESVFHVQTNFNNGLQEEHVQKVIELLK